MALAPQKAPCPALLLSIGGCQSLELYPFTHAQAKSEVTHFGLQLRLLTGTYPAFIRMSAMGGKQTLGGAARRFLSPCFSELRSCPAKRLLLTSTRVGAVPRAVSYFHYVAFMAGLDVPKHLSVGRFIRSRNDCSIAAVHKPVAAASSATRNVGSRVVTCEADGPFDRLLYLSQKLRVLLPRCEMAGLSTVIAVS